MVQPHRPPAPMAPVPTMPPRVPGSVRRTSHIDMRWSEGGPGTLRLVGGARDVRTGSDGRGEVLASGSLDTLLDPDMHVRALRIEPPFDPDPLLGTNARSRFRAAARAAHPELQGTPLGLLLDDVPVAALIALYAIQRRVAPGTEEARPVPPEAADRQVDLCAGFDATGTMILSMRAGLGLPYEQGPDAPAVATDDPLDWHEEPPLPPGAMRRRRRIDVLDGPVRRIDAFFRDTLVRRDGVEEVLHEYTVEARLTDDDRIAAIYAAPRVLPFGECPRAAAHVGRLVGEPVAELRSTVPATLTSLSSCTHLNDLLRALADVPALEALLTRRPR